MVEGRVVAQLQGVVEGDPVGLPDRREHLRLLHRVDPQIRLEVEVHVQQIRRVTRLLGNDRQHPLLDLAGNAGGRRGLGRRDRLGRGRGGRRGLRRRGAGSLVDEPDHVVEGRVVAQLQVSSTLDPVGLPDGREHLRLLHRVDPQIRLEVEVHVQQIRRVTRLLGNDRQHPLLDLAGNAGGRRGLGRRRPARPAARAAGAGSAGAAPDRSLTNPTTWLRVG